MPRTWNAVGIMADMASPSSDLMRTDPLTGCKNFFGFLESCMDPSAAEISKDLSSERKIAHDRFAINALQFSAVLFVSLNDMRYLNETKGFAHGDSAVRWMGILLQEETNQTVYRFGIEFAVLLQMDDEQAHIQLLERILERMQREAKLLEFPGAPADIALVFNDQSSTCLDSLLMQMGEAMVRVKNSQNGHHMIFHATEFKIPAWSPHTWGPAGCSDISYTVRWITRASICHVVEMGKNLDMAHQDAYTDAITNLPNMRAAIANLEEVLQNARTKREPFSILFIDGDNTRDYNLISYAAGDEMIRQICAVFKQNLRANDFVARWRCGDEFVVTLPNTTAEEAQDVGERFRSSVKNAFKTCKIPATISIGISSYPANGEDIDTLIEKVETANKRAKQQGKDQVVLAA